MCTGAPASAAVPKISSSAPSLSQCRFAGASAART